MSDLCSVLDLVFKWVSIKFKDSSNTTFIVKIFSFLSELITGLELVDYQLWDNEAAVLFPTLTEKTGINNQPLKEQAKKILRQAINIYDV